MNSLVPFLCNDSLALSAVSGYREHDQRGSMIKVYYLVETNLTPKPGAMTSPLPSIAL